MRLGLCGDGKKKGTKPETRLGLCGNGVEGSRDKTQKKRRTWARDTSRAPYVPPSSALCPRLSLSPSAFAFAFVDVVVVAGPVN